ncbi:MAG: SAM-dependent methyltransferase [Phycisphaeraceae bacterium]|nr:SAM-dependent methyltransferase [Phycisphaeraceae bacterium]
MSSNSREITLPSAEMDASRMPGYWVMARLGKRVLRPGGLDLTRAMLERLQISKMDDVIEFAPGLGQTAQLVLKQHPASYTAVESDADTAAHVRQCLGEDHAARRVLVEQAQETTLPNQCASVVYSEAILTTQPQTSQRKIVGEAFRLLKPGGRYGIHELAIQIDGDDPSRIQQISKQIADATHHSVFTMKSFYWRQLLMEAGFDVIQQMTTPMRLLEPRQIIQDEGWLGASRFMLRLLSHSAERRRVMQMRKIFRQLRSNLCGICLIATKPTVA